MNSHSWIPRSAFAAVVLTLASLGAGSAQAQKSANQLRLELPYVVRQYTSLKGHFDRVKAQQRPIKAKINKWQRRLNYLNGLNSFQYALQYRPVGDYNLAGAIKAEQEKLNVLNRQAISYQKKYFRANDEVKRIQTLIWQAEQAEARKKAEANRAEQRRRQRAEAQRVERRRQQQADRKKAESDRAARQRRQRAEAERRANAKKNAPKPEVDTGDKTDVADKPETTKTDTADKPETTKTDSADKIDVADKPETNKTDTVDPVKTESGDDWAGSRAQLAALGLLDPEVRRRHPAAQDELEAAAMELTWSLNEQKPTTRQPWSPEIAWFVQVLHDRYYLPVKKEYPGSVGRKATPDKYRQWIVAGSAELDKVESRKLAAHVLDQLFRRQSSRMQFGAAGKLVTAQAFTFGFSQLTLKTSTALAKVVKGSPFDPMVNARIGARYLNSLMPNGTRAGLTLGLARYLGGETPSRRAQARARRIVRDAVTVARRSAPLSTKTSPNS